MTCQVKGFTGVTKTKPRWQNWSYDVDFEPECYFEPKHQGRNPVHAMEQLALVVAAAKDANQPVRAIGSGWAFEDIAATEGWTVCLDKLNRRLTYLVDKGRHALTSDARGRHLVHYEAGIRVFDLADQLNGRNLALPTMGGSNGQKLAGVISTSTHGGDWDQPPFPDLVRAVHLVRFDGTDVWIEPKTDPITDPDDTTALQEVLPSKPAEIIHDDDIFNAVIVGCGRFGIVYSFVLEVQPQFRLVGVVTTPSRGEVLQALRDGVTNGTLFQPLFDLLARTPPPAKAPDATGDPYFLQVLFNSQFPENLWVTRRWVTTNTTDVLPASDTEQKHVDTATEVLVGAQTALGVAITQHLAVGDLIGAGIISGALAELDLTVASRPFVEWSVAAAALTAIWKLGLGAAVPALNGFIINDRMQLAENAGVRGPHYLMTAGTEQDSDTKHIRAASIEVVFDATTTDYLDFLQEILNLAPLFQQAGYVSLRPSRRSRAFLSMHGVAGSHAMSIEISSLKGLPGNEPWMWFVHQRAVAHNGRPHWGQFNKMDALDTTNLYGDSLNRWREALLQVNGTSKAFSNEFCRQRGLEPSSIVREVTAVRRAAHGAITHLCHDGAAWSPVTVKQAIRDIKSGTVRYFVRGTRNQEIPVKVVGGRYLRSQADETETNNLDELPPC